MLLRKSPKDNIFFEQFIETAKIICEASNMLKDLMVEYTDIDIKVRAIEQKEHDCDQLVHNIFEQLNKTFITPIDREDIYLIAKELDNITDFIEATAHRFIMFNITSIRKEAIEMIDVIISCTCELVVIMEDLRNMKKSKTLKDRIIEVNRLENVADNIFREAIKNLFATETNPIEIIKWKETLEYLENTLDACEDVANIIEGVVMKHA